MAYSIPEGLNLFLPVFSFLLVFVLVYAILAKSKILGDNKFVNLLVGFIFAIFFILNSSLTDFIKFNAAWVAVFVVCALFILIMLAFLPAGTEFLKNAKWLGWVIVLGLIIFFVVSSSFVFNWTLNWEKVWGVFYNDWMGFALLVIVAVVVSWVLYKMK